jgi:RNA polymerase sigma factor (sigma-70 family)
MISQLQAIEEPKGRQATKDLGETGAGLSGPSPRSAPLYVDHVAHPDYLRAAAEKELFGPDAPSISVVQWRARPEFDEDQEEVTLPKAAANLTRQDEAVLFMRYNYARYRLDKLTGEQRRRFSRGRASEVLAWQRRADDNRAALANANMGLVLAMVKRMRINSVDFDELVSEGNITLLRTVDKFDVARGFKFSTYACGAILRALVRLVFKAGTYHKRFPVNFVPEMEQTDELERRNDDQRELDIEDLRRVLTRNRAGLTDIEQTVVAARFALDGYDRVHTLEELSKILSLSKERVRQVQNVAVTKLRRSLEPTSSPRAYLHEVQPVLRRLAQRHSAVLSAIWQ